MSKSNNFCIPLKSVKCMYTVKNKMQIIHNGIVHLQNVYLVSNTVVFNHSILGNCQCTGILKDLSFFLLIKF